jgi:hypothetical protein
VSRASIRCLSLVRMTAGQMIDARMKQKMMMGVVAEKNPIVD